MLLVRFLPANTRDKSCDLDSLGKLVLCGLGCQAFDRVSDFSEPELDLAEMVPLDRACLAVSAFGARK